ncbi:hypothetical protein [Bacillus sp. B1-b2]|uniref:hypothetical protein n=1 Tax=Bacillus sp. B1-b2 TaxID=2653201 RepID=UPI0039AF7E7D
MKKLLLIPLLVSLTITTVGANVHATANKDGYSPISFDLQLLSWEQMNPIIPKFSVFTIIDVESGKHFQVQRRAGSQHADVQPLNKKETQIMKDIYQGRWSWKRRAIIVMVEDKWFAASMHGMPHGAGALDNQFPGHFCVHFLGSTTHKTDKMDFSHKLMVYKAAGILKEYLDQQNPNDVVQSFVAGMKEQDFFILNYLATEHIEKKRLAAIENIKLVSIEDKKPEQYQNGTEIDIEVVWNVYKKNTPPIKERKIIHLMRASSLEPWKVLMKEDLL